MSKRKQTFQRPIRMGSPVNGTERGEILNLNNKKKLTSLISSAPTAPIGDEDFNSPEEKGSNGHGPNDFHEANSKINGIPPQTEAQPCEDPSRQDTELTREQKTATQTDPNPPPKNDEEPPGTELNNKLAQLLTAAPSLAFPWTSADASPFYTQPAGAPKEMPTQESDPGGFKLKDLLNAAKCRTPVMNGCHHSDLTERSNATERSTLLPVPTDINGSPGPMIRPFACRECGFAFTNKSNCERHMRKKHGKKSRRELLKHYGATTPVPTSEGAGSNSSSSSNSCNSGSTRSSSGSDDGVAGSTGPENSDSGAEPARSTAQVNGSEVHVTYKCRLCEEQFGKQDLAIKHVVLKHPQVENILETIAELENPPLAATTPSPREQTSESSSEPLDFSVSKSRPGPDLTEAQKPAVPPQASVALEALHRWLPPNPFFAPGWPPLGLPTTPYYSPEINFANHRGQVFPDEAEMCDGREIRQEESASEFKDGVGGEEVLVGAELAAELPPSSSPFFDPRAVPYRTPGPRKFVCVYCHNTYSSRGNVNRHIRNTHFKMKRTSTSSCSASVGAAGFTKRPNCSYSGPFNGHQETPPMAVNTNGRSSSTSDGQSLPRELLENGVEKCRSRSNLDRYYEEGCTPPPPAKIKRESENGIEEAFRKYYSQYYYYPPYGPPPEAAGNALNGQHPSLTFFENYKKSLAAPGDREQTNDISAAVEDTNGLDLSLVSARKKELIPTTCSSSTPSNGATNNTSACAKPAQNGTNGNNGSHSGMRPSPCPLCGLNFSTKSNRNRHIFRKHRQTYASIRGSFPIGSSGQSHPLGAPPNHCSFQNGGTTLGREEERDNYSSDECERETPLQPSETEGKMDLVKEEPMLPFSCTICKEGGTGETVSFRDQASLLAHAFTRHKDELNTKYRNMIPAAAQLSAKPDRAGSVLSSYLAYFSSLSNTANSNTTPGCSPEPSIAGDEGSQQQRQWLCTICRITFSLKHSLIRHHKRHAARSLNDPHNFVPVEMMLELSPSWPELEDTSTSITTNNSLLDTTGSLCGSRVLQNLLGIHDAKELEHLVMNQGAGTGGGVPSNA